MAQVAAISAAGVSRRLDKFQICREFAGSIWNHFKTRLFPLHLAAPVNIDWIATEGFPSK
jgi:hypothetical protein